MDKVNSKVSLNKIDTNVSLNEVNTKVLLNEVSSSNSLNKVNEAVDENCGCRFKYCGRCLEVFKPSPIYLNEDTRGQLNEDDLILEKFKALVMIFTSLLFTRNIIIFYAIEKLICFLYNLSFVLLLLLDVFTAI